MPGLIAREWRYWCTAVQFFTRLPTPNFADFEMGWLNRSTRYVGLVGMLVGALAALCFWLAAQVWSPWVAAVLATLVSAWVTGFFHEDGLADTFDALGGQVSRERALAIMHDSRIGTYGAVSLILILGLRIACLASLPISTGALMLFLSHVFARLTAISLLSDLVYVRSEADTKAKPMATELDAATLLTLLGTGLAAAALVLGHLRALWPAVLGALVACLLVRLVCAAWYRRRLGGYTGDTLGAAEQLSETAVLLAAAAALAP